MTEQHNTNEDAPAGPPPVAGQTEDGRVYVVAPQAMAVESAPRRTTRKGPTTVNRR